MYTLYLRYTGFLHNYFGPKCMVTTWLLGRFPCMRVGGLKARVSHALCFICWVMLGGPWDPTCNACYLLFLFLKSLIRQLGTV